MPALPESKPYQFISIDDFSPGIYGEWYAGTGQQAAPDGAAQQTGTYGCVASQAGALIPAPRLVNSYVEQQFDTDTANYPSSDNATHITAFKNISSVNTYPQYSWQQFFPNADKTNVSYKTDSGGTTNLYQIINVNPVSTAHFINDTSASGNGQYNANFGTGSYSLGSRSITIQSVQLVTTMKPGVSDTGGVQLGLNVNGTIYQASSRPSGASTRTVNTATTATQYDLFPNNPNTGVAWTVADIAQFASRDSFELLGAGVGLVSGRNYYQVYLAILAVAPISSGFFDQSFYTFQWWKSSAAGAPGLVQKTKVRTYKFTQSPVTTFDLANVTTTAQVVLPTTLNYGYTSLDGSRANKTTPTSPGNAFVASVVNPWLDNTVYSALVYPDGTSAATAATDSTATLTITGTNAVRLCAHQDRIIAVVNGTIQSFGATSAIGFEELRATKTNDYSTDSGVDSIFVNESPGNIGAMISMNASELYVLKNHGGGYSMRGDIVTPQIIRLPGVPSADINHIPCATPVAMIYGNSQGVWEFSGGDNATCISQQLDGRFWVPPFTQNYLGPVGSFAYIYPYVFAPNNWLWDIRKRAWFRLTNPATTQYAWASGSAEGLMILAPPQFRSGQSIADWYDIHQGQSSYQWTSQPLQRSLGRELTFGEINLTGAGNGTVTVTLQGASEIPPVTESVVFSSQTPVTRNIRTRMKGFDIVAVITSTAASTGPAPTVYRMTLGYEEAQTARGGA